MLIKKNKERDRMIFSEVSFGKLFLEKFSESCERNGVKKTPQLSEYISSLFSDNLLSNRVPEPNLILSQLLRSSNGDPQVFDELKNTAEYIIIHLGYFPESLASKRYFTLDNYFDLGKKSYYHLYQMNGRDYPFKDVYLNYDNIVFSVNETADSLGTHTSKEVMITHQCWERTRHKIFKKKLLRMGLNTTLVEE